MSFITEDSSALAFTASLVKGVIGKAEIEKAENRNQTAPGNPGSFLLCDADVRPFCFLFSF
jgi:hypothetical protein